MNTRRLSIRPHLLLVTIALTVTGVTTLAHDMWIEPTSFSTRAGEILGLRLLIGQDLLGDPLPRSSTLINQFVVEDATGRRAVVGRDGTDPAGLVRIATAGLSVIGYWSNPSRVELPAEKFNQYLIEEGLETVAITRSRRHETDRNAREIFTRCAKSLIASGPQLPAMSDRRLGFTLEIIAERNPYALRQGELLPVILSFEGRPLEGALIVAFDRLSRSEKVKVRTDRDGRARIPLARPGLWLVKAVHMVPALADANADWASYWASLTFDLSATGSAIAVR